MMKVKLSRVSWPGNSWMPFTFQPGLQALQQPHKDSYSLQLPTCIHTHWTSQHSACFMNSFPFIVVVVFFSQDNLQSTANAHQSPKMTLERATSHIKALK